MVSEIDWGTLLTKAKEGECVPFIGAAACRDVLPSAAALSEALLLEDESLTGRPCLLAKRDDLGKAAQYLAVTHKDGKYPKLKIRDHLSGIPWPAARIDDDPHHALGALNLPLYLTTNYDDYMPLALKQRSGVKEVEREICRWNSDLLANVPSAFDKGYQPARDHPAVFHLHGRLDRPESMVASEDDYLDFLVGMAKGLAFSPKKKREPAMLPLAIRNALANHTLLFVGYGLGDVNFKVILRGLATSLKSNESYSVTVQFEDKPEKMGATREYLEEYFQWVMKLDVFWGSAQQFAVTLHQKLGFGSGHV